MWEEFNCEMSCWDQCAMGMYGGGVDGKCLVECEDYCEES